MIPHIKRWEGGYSCDPDDRGGCTMTGITLATYRRYYGASKTCADLKRITESEWLTIFKAGYWDKMMADQIANQSLAELCVDMCWMSGATTAIIKIQRTIGTTADGIVGRKTLYTLNKDPKGNFEKLWQMRYNWLCSIAQVGNNRKFLKGWLNRLNSQKYRA
jgi:lysozyme family protein